MQEIIIVQNYLYIYCIYWHNHTLTYSKLEGQSTHGEPIDAKLTSFEGGLQTIAIKLGNIQSNFKNNEKHTSKHSRT